MNAVGVVVITGSGETSGTTVAVVMGSVVVVVVSSVAGGADVEAAAVEATAVVAGTWRDTGPHRFQPSAYTTLSVHGASMPWRWLQTLTAREQRTATRHAASPRTCCLARGLIFGPNLEAGRLGAAASAIRPMPLA